MRVPRFSRAPIRTRIAAVSAGLTFAILVAFALVVGRLFTDRLNENFNEELQTAASQIAFDLQISPNSGVHPAIDAMSAEASALRLVTAAGNLWGDNGSTPGAPDLGPPSSDVREIGDLRVASGGPIITNFVGIPPLYVEYARDTRSLETTIHRLWLFLGVGVFTGTLLAALSGIAIARRAMRPISSLTAAAGEIASTRDPSQGLPQPPTDDEVAELARTLDRMLRALDDARSETQAMVLAQREFVADASHELRTPLTSILANLELLDASLQGTPDSQSGERGEIVASALRSSKRMSRLVSDLLLLARADAGRTAPRRACELGEIAEAAVAESAPISGARTLATEIRGPAPVIGNPDELHRLVSNLIDNAIRHTPDGTRVGVGIRIDAESVLLEVSDNGPGLPAELGDQVFERFVHGSGPADLSATAGTGLGLAIVHSVATSHGGSVVAGASSSGGGSFTVRLPLARQPAESVGSQH